MLLLDQDGVRVLAWTPDLGDGDSKAGLPWLPGTPAQAEGLGKPGALAFLE